MLATLASLHCVKGATAVATEAVKVLQKLVAARARALNARRQLFALQARFSRAGSLK